MRPPEDEKTSAFRNLLEQALPDPGSVLPFPGRKA